jgi:hypothetical protein
MMCTCPKCHAAIELDLPEVTEAGTTAVCPACNARFNISRESFGSRALHKTGEISCAPCGAILGPQMHCPACGARFPDYLVVSLGRKKARREGKKLKLKTSPFPQQQAATQQIPSLEMSLRPEEAKSTPILKAVKAPKPVVLVVSLLVAVALIAAGSVFFLKYKAEKAYAKNFVLATYCLQTGMDRALKASNKISTDWKQKSDAGLAYVPRGAVDDDRDFGLITSKLGSALQAMAKPPEKFATCPEKLTKFQNVFTKLHGLVLEPGNSLPGFVDSAAKQEAEYKQLVKEYKSGLPEQIIEELTSASLKFKNLRPLVAR